MDNEEKYQDVKGIEETDSGSLAGRLVLVTLAVFTVSMLGYWGWGLVFGHDNDEPYNNVQTILHTEYISIAREKQDCELGGGVWAIERVGYTHYMQYLASDAPHFGEYSMTCTQPSRELSHSYLK